MPKVNLGRIRTVFKGEWVPGTYVIDDVVLYAGSSYTCIAPATLSNNPTDTTFWVQSAGGIEFTGTWDTAITYKTNQIVTFNQQTYIAITAHSGTEPTATGQTDWSVMAGGFKFEGAWNVATAYQINDIVVFGGSTYIATSNQTGTQPEAVGNASWSLFAAKGDSFADQAGHAGKVLKTNGTDTSWTNVGIPELGIADGDESGWLLSTDGAGTLSFVTPPISSAGGTPYDQDHIGNYLVGETWDDHDSYGRVHQYTKGQFAWQHQTFDNQNTMRVRLRVMPFQVDQTTGIITRGTAGYGFQNNGGYAHSTSSFGFCGNIGMSWGNTPWGSNTSHYAGGCTWRVNDDNTVTQGSNTGNSTYAGENTSNGMLALYQYGSNTYWNIPHSSYTSLGNCNTSNAAVNDWSNANESGGSYSTTYIWRCIGNTVGINHAGVVSDSQGVRAMIATGSNGYTGSYMTNMRKNDRSGIGFELDNGRQIFMDSDSYNIGVRNSYSDALSAGILTVISGSDSGLPWVAGLGQDLSYNTTGTPAVEADTFYFTTNQNILMKFRFENTGGYNYNMVILGSVDLDAYGQNNFYSYTRWSGITGDNDKFLVLAWQQSSYNPHHTFVLDNPLMDA